MCECVLRCVCVCLRVFACVCVCHLSHSADSLVGPPSANNLVWGYVCESVWEYVRVCESV